MPTFDSSARAIITSRARCLALFAPVRSRKFHVSLHLFWALFGFIDSCPITQINEFGTARNASAAALDSKL